MQANKNMFCIISHSFMKDGSIYMDVLCPGDLSQHVEIFLF